MSDIEIDFNQDLHANEHACPSPAGEPLCSRAKIQEDFHTPIALDANANRMFSQGRLTTITLQELRHIETLQQIKFIDVQILRIIVQRRGANNLAYTYNNSRGRNTGIQSNQVNYARLFLVRIFNETEMDKLAYIIKAKGVNQTIWHGQIELRD